MKEKTINEIFASRKLDLQVTISSRQKTALESMQSNNNHSAVRVRLAELFFAPEELVKELKRIKREHDKQGSISYELIQARDEQTKKLNKFIKANFGKKALDFALSVE